MISIEILNSSHKKFRELLKLEGDFFDQLLEEWYSLASNEKDECTHPVYVMNFLNVWQQITKQEFYLICVLNEKRCITVIPVYKKSIIIGLKFNYLEAITISMGSSLALRKKYHREVFKQIFENRKLSFFKLLFIKFNVMNETNSLLKAPLNLTIIPESYRQIIKISQGMEKIINQSARSIKRCVRNNFNKLNDTAKIHFDVFSETSEIMKEYDVFITFESEGWKGKTATSLKNNEQARLFYRNILKDFSYSHRAAIFKLRLNNIILAMFAGFMIEETFYGILITYNDNYACYSPGHMLLYKMFQYLPKEYNIKYFNTMSESPWFHLWRPQKVKTFKVFIFRNKVFKSLFAVTISMYRIIRSRYNNKIRSEG